MKRTSGISLILFVVLGCMLTLGCAKLKIQVAEGVDQFSKKEEKPITHRILLTGDAGHSKKGLTEEMSDFMKQVFQETGAESTLLMLGDNIRSIGGDEDPSLLNTPANLALIKMVNAFKGKAYFLPGDLEWLENNQKGVNQIEKWIQKRVPAKDNFIPDDGCPGPEVEEINDQLVIIAFDSRWFIEDWNRNQQHNESCEIRYRSDLLLELKNEIKKYYLTHNVILAMHHPVMSTGRRGGYSSFKDHIFPISSLGKNFPIPLPVIGSVITFITKKVPGYQDIQHPTYQAMSKTIDRFNRDFPGLIVVSAHEFNLQYHRDKTQHYIVSGALTVSDPVCMTDSAFFTYGGPGISRLNIFDDGAVELEFLKPGKNNSPEVIFSRMIKAPIPTVEEQMPDEFPMFKQLKDSVVVTISTDQKIRKYSENLWGKLNTDLYYLPVKLPVFNLDTVKGGLVPFRRGGSNQTNSVRLKDKQGRVYQIRSLRKNPDRLVPYPFNKTFATDLAAKQMTAGNPFGAITLLPMEKAVNIYHGNPQVVYVPKQPGLREYNDLGDEVYLFEERPDEDWSSLESFGNSSNIIGHFNMREDLLANNKSTVNQEMALRCRLFDMLIGDWDRHDDQWRWATFEDSSGMMRFDPVPRDRDQVYAMYGGLIPNYLRTTLPFFHSLQRFDNEVKDKDVKWLNRQARNFDRLYLNHLTWKDWEAQIRFMQRQLTDDIIKEAVNRFPAEVKASSLDEEITQKLISRRDDLLHTARIYYRFLYKIIEIPGTNKPNLFEIERIDDQNTKVTVYEYRDKKTAKDLIYERNVSHDPTEDIFCFGLDGDDEFVVTGKVSKGIKIILVGGNGDDHFVDESKVNGLAKKTMIYDVKEGTKIDKSAETKKRLSGNYRFNNYRYNHHEYDYGFVIPLFGFNSDEGFILKAIYNAKTFGYRKAQEHTVGASYSFGNNGLEVSYAGIYANTFGKSAMTLDAHIRRPRYVFNFYGLGNGTLNEREDDSSSEYYRVSEESLYFSPGIRHYFTKYRFSSFSLAPTFERIKIQEIDDKFLSDNVSEVDDEVFEVQRYVGAKMSLDFYSVDKPTFPRKGLFFGAGTKYNAQLQSNGKHYVNLNAETGFYQPIGRKSGIVLASKLGFEHLVGDFNFYYATRIGGENNLRGFPNQRFTGKTSFYHSTDIRYSIVKTRIARLPVIIGVNGGFDYGRVWIENDDSDKWHTSYGGQLWISPLGYFVLSSGVFFSEEGSRISVKIGFDF